MADRTHHIRNPKRVASPSHRGHHYGFICAAREWLNLAGDDYLVVEGNEDVDIVEARSRRTEIQYKTAAKPFGAGEKWVMPTVLHFFAGWLDSRRDGEDYRGVLQTPASLRPAKRPTAIADWISGTPPDEAKLRGAIRKRLAASGDDCATLDGLTSDEFHAFLDVVCWRTGSEDLELESQLLRTKLGELVPDLDRDLALNAVHAAVRDRAMQPNASDRLLDEWFLWETLNRATLQSLSSEKRLYGANEAVIVWRTHGEVRATCLLVATSANPKPSLPSYSPWGHGTKDEQAVRYLEGHELVAYVYIGTAERHPSHARGQVLKQARYAFPNLRPTHQPSSSILVAAAETAARRCAEYSTTKKRELINRFLTKIRWIRYPDGTLETLSNRVEVPRQL